MYVLLIFLSTCTHTYTCTYTYQGGWVLLQNCHLGLDFMDELLDTITEAESMHDSCRVWITTEAHPKFSISLLQVCVGVYVCSVCVCVCMCGAWQCMCGAYMCVRCK